MKSLILILIILWLNDATTSGITQVLLQLNAEYKTELNIFINLEDVSKETLNLQVLETPSVHLQTTINTFNNFHLLGTFTEKTLIILNLNRQPLDDATTKILPYLLRGLHELHIVFYSERDPTHWHETLYSFCIQEGFINVLLIYLNNRIQLYSYNPYPTVKPLKLHGIKDYLNRWRNIRNFHNLTVRTIPDIIEPRRLEYVNRKGQLVHGGYVFNSFFEFYKRHNATIKFLPHLPPDGAFEKGFELFNRKLIDFVSYPKELTWNLSGTVPLYPLKHYIIVPHARPLASYLYFARPFTWTLWIGVIVIVGFSSLVLYASYGFDRSEFGLHFLSCWCHLLFLPQPQVRIFNWQQSLIHVILTLTGFVLTNLYLALLSSMLTLGLFGSQFNTLQDLKYSPYPLMVDDYYIHFLKNAVSIPVEVRDHMFVESPVNLLAARIGLNSSYMYNLYDDRMDGILYQQHLLKVPRFKKIPESILDGLLAFPVVQSLPYLNMLNEYFRRIFECGILSKMKSDSWRDTIDAGIYKLLRNEGTEQKPFEFNFYLLAFLLWTLGLTLASLCFLLEWFIWWTA